MICIELTESRKRDRSRRRRRRRKRREEEERGMRKLELSIKQKSSEFINLIHNTKITDITSRYPRLK